MPDDPVSRDTAQTPPVLRPPESQIPLVYADGVSSQWYNSAVTKTHFIRYDPDPRAIAPASAVTIFQLVTPVEGFAAITLFFERRLKTMVKEGVISKEQIEALRAAYDWE